MVVCILVHLILVILLGLLESFQLVNIVMDMGVNTRLLTRVSRTSTFRPTRSPYRIILVIAIYTDLIYSDCSGVTTEISAICASSLTRYADSVALVALTATFLSKVVDIQGEISRLAVSVNFSMFS